MFAQVKRENKASKNKSRSHQVTIHQKWFPLFTRDFSRFYDQLWSMAGGHYTVSRSGRSGSKITNVLRSAASPIAGKHTLAHILPLGARNVAFGISKNMENSEKYALAWAQIERKKVMNSSICRRALTLQRGTRCCLQKQVFVGSSSGKCFFSASQRSGGNESSRKMGLKKKWDLIAPKQR